MALPLIPIALGAATLGAKKLYDVLNDSNDYDDSDDEITLGEIMCDIARHYLSSEDYAELRELANAKSLSEADNAEYISLETKAKEPILSALDSFNFADCLVAIIRDRLNSVEIVDIKRFDGSKENLSIWLFFVALAFDDAVLKELLREELVGDKMSIVEKWGRFIDYLEVDDCDEDEEDNYSIIDDIVRNENLDNDKKLQKILRRFDDSDRKTITDFESICGEVVKVVKDFLNQPLIELYRDSD